MKTGITVTTGYWGSPHENKTMGIQRYPYLFFSIFLYLLIPYKGINQSIPDKEQIGADTASVSYLLNKSAMATNPDTARLLAQDARALSEAINYERGIRKSLTQLIAISKAQKDLTGILRYSLEALRLLEKGDSYADIFNTYIDISQIYQSEKLHIKALEYLQLAAKIPSESTPISSRIELYHSLGDNYFQINQPDSALYYYKELFRQFEIESIPDKISLYQKMATACNKKKAYDLSLQYNMLIKELIDQEGNAKDIAYINNNIGYNYTLLKNYEKAINHFEATAAICLDREYVELSEVYTNIGIAYNNMGEFSKAIYYLLEARKRFSGNSKIEQQAYLDNLISLVYLKNGDTYNALQYNGEVIQKAESNRFMELLSESYNIAANIHQNLHEYETALDFYKKHLELRDSFRLEERLKQQELLQQQFMLERAEKEIKLLLVNQEVKDLTINQLQLEKEKLNLERKTQEDELKLLKQEQDIQQGILRNKELETQKAQQELALAEQRLIAEKKDRDLVELERIEAEQRLELERKERAEKENEQAIALLTRDKDLLEKKERINQLEISRQKTFQQAAYGIGGLLFIISLLILAGLLMSRRSNKKLEQKNAEIELQKVEIEKERNKAESLLLNILPKDTADELKENGFATPKHYDKVSILFTDFSDFTSIAKNMTPQNLIEELNTCFKAFDEIIEKYGLEKIKTIGDAYMAAGGIPLKNDSNPVDAVAAGLEMKAYMDKRLATKIAKGEPYWEMRIGIHTGQVVAGVVGLKKFAYDIWGDAVNTASRMESSGESGKVNISGETYTLIKDYFQCNYRGEIEAKNKGKIGMYFVEAPKNTVGK